MKFPFNIYKAIAILLLVISLLVFGKFLKTRISFYYAHFFNSFTHKKLKNSEEEAARINTIIENNLGNVFGLDLSHYQEKEQIKWDSLSIGNKTVPLQFVFLRATMGNRSNDKNFAHFWEKAKENKLIRGAYHFYRADEDPVIQANHFLDKVKLESGDLPPVLDIEKIPRKKTNEKLVEDLKTWCKIIEDAYGVKPILYSYYYYHKDFLEGNFEGYPLWLANYNPVPSPSPDADWDFWQFSENGIVYGINSKVDLNVYNGGLWSLKRLTID